MSLQNDSGFLTLTAAADTGANVRVKVDNSGNAAIAGATESGIGVTQHAIVAGAPVSIKLWSAPGTWQFVSAGAVTAGAELYAAANGKVDDSGTVSLGLMSPEGASTDGVILSGYLLRPAGPVGPQGAAGPQGIAG